MIVQLEEKKRQKAAEEERERREAAMWEERVRVQQEKEAREYEEELRKKKEKEVKCKLGTTLHIFGRLRLYYVFFCVFLILYLSL